MAPATHLILSYTWHVEILYGIPVDTALELDNRKLISTVHSRILRQLAIKNPSTAIVEQCSIKRQFKISKHKMPDNSLNLLLHSWLWNHWKKVFKANSQREIKSICRSRVRFEFTAGLRSEYHRSEWQDKGSFTLRDEIT